MNKQNLKTLKIIILVGLAILLSACSLLGSGNDQEVEALQEQIDQMATQNARLQSQIESSGDEGIQAPPPPAGDSQPDVNVITPTPEALPTNPVAAGVPITYDGWRLLVNKNIEIDKWESKSPTPVIYLTIVVENLGMENRVFRFSNSAISLRDDLGNNYAAFPGYELYGYDCEKEFYTLKNLTIRGEKSVTLEGSPMACEHDEFFQAFEGPIPAETNQLILMFNDFGPFTGIEVVIDL